MTNCFTITADGIREGIAFQRGPVFGKDGEPRDLKHPVLGARPAVWLGGDERDERNRVTRVFVKKCPKSNLLTSASFECDGKHPAWLVSGKEKDVIVYIRTGFPAEPGAHTSFHEVALENAREEGSGRTNFGSWTHPVPKSKKGKPHSFDELWHLTEGASLAVSFSSGLFKRFVVKDGALVDTVLEHARKPAVVEPVAAPQPEPRPVSAIAVESAPAASAAPAPKKRKRATRKKKPVKAMKAAKRRFIEKKGAPVFKSFGQLAEAFGVQPSA